MLAAVAAVVGLAAAHRALEWGIAAYYSGQTGGPPFWIDPGLKISTTVLYAAGLTLLGASILGILPALKVTGARVQTQLRNIGAGGSTLRFGKLWTTAMIAQVALTVLCIPPAMGIAQEAWRDRMIRDRFPAEEYLAVRVDLDREMAATAPGEDTASAFAQRRSQMMAEFERRVMQEPGVRAVTFADRLPGMGPAVQRAEVETAPGSAPIPIANLWTASVGANFFEAFDIPVVAGRDFHDGDRAPGAQTVLVNAAFARRYMDGASPVGTTSEVCRHQCRHASSPGSKSSAWSGTSGMTPTDLGEAPYVFRAASAATTYPLMLAVRTTNDPRAIASRLRAIAFDLDAGLRLDDMRTLDEYAWRVDVPADGPRRRHRLRRRARALPVGGGNLLARCP